MQTHSSFYFSPKKFVKVRFPVNEEKYGQSSIILNEEWMSEHFRAGFYLASVVPFKELELEKVFNAKTETVVRTDADIKLPWSNRHHLYHSHRPWEAPHPFAFRISKGKF